MRMSVIVFEGIDGVGKSTQAKILEEKLKTEGINSVVLHFPSQGILGREIRKLLQRGLFDRLDAKARAFLTVADFFNEFSKYKRFSGVMIFDRYWHSSLASNQGQGDITDDWILSLHQEAPMPDIVFFLDCQPEKIIERQGADFGAQDIGRQKMIRQSYLKVFERYLCVRVDASKRRKDIAQEIWNTVQTFLARK